MRDGGQYRSTVHPDLNLSWGVMDLVHRMKLDIGAYH